MVEAGQWLRPQWFPRAGEADWLESVTRETRTVREQGRCLRRLHPRQDRHPGKGRGSLPRPRLHQHVLDPAHRQGALRSHAAGGRLRAGRRHDRALRPRALRPVHHDGERRQGHAAPRVLPSGAVARPRRGHGLGHRAMVAIRRGRTALPRRAPAGSRRCFRLSQDDAFPYLACAAFKLDRVPLRLFRLSFSGELAYEIACPARYGEALLDALMAACTALDGTAYGTEALSVLRIEKGHVAGGELNGQTTARDLGLGRMMSTQEGLYRPRHGRPARARGP